MLQTMVSLLDAERTIHVQVHDGLADVLLAALSAEPTTIAEFRDALGRYLEPEVVAFVFREPREGWAERPTDGGHLMIDFAACLVVNHTASAAFPRVGCVLRCDQVTTLDVWLPYRIPAQWQMVKDQRRDWQALALRRRERSRGADVGDVRAVLYGKLAASLVARHAEVGGREAGPWCDIHDWWLLTARQDLAGRSPREVLLARRAAVDGDVQDQGETWSLLGHAPPGLSPRSHAYRFAGFGTHEIILYHELVATLLRELDGRTRDAAGADLSGEIRHLEQLQQEWMHQPQTDLYDQSPAALIARERARLPAVVPPGHEHLDHDCPLCRMMAESAQPMIWQLDDFHLEQRFATSFCTSRADWERRRDDGDSHENSHEVPAGMPVAPPRLRDENSVWQNSFTNMAGLTDMPPRESVTIMLFAVGGHLGELVHDLNTHRDGTELVRQLHLRFDDLRGCLREQSELCLVRSSIASFAAALEDVAEARTDLRAKCSDLEDKLNFLEQRYATHLGQDVEML